MSKEDKQLFLDELGLESSGLDRLIQKGYELLGLISYLTAGKQEVRAWTIKRAPKRLRQQAKIHSDFEKGFIRAEVVAFDDLEACGSMAAAKKRGSSAPKVRIMCSRTEMWFCSALTSDLCHLSKTTPGCIRWMLAGGCF